MNEFQLLAELFRILGSVDEHSLQSALAHQRSPEILDVLEALLRAHRLHKQREALRPATGHPLPTEVPHPDESSIEQFISMMASSSLSHGALAGELRKSGIAVAVGRSRDTKRDLMRRAVTYFRSLTPRRQAEVLIQLARRLGVDQTEGWMKVIRSQN